jgi:hypothetical protein
LGKLTPQECWGACAWSREFAARVIGDAEYKPFKLGREYRQTDKERRLRYIAENYGKLFEEIAKEEGTAEGLGRVILEAVQRAKDEKEALVSYWQKLKEGAEKAVA